MKWFWHGTFVQLWHPADSACYFRQNFTKYEFSQQLSVTTPIQDFTKTHPAGAGSFHTQDTHKANSHFRHVADSGHETRAACVPVMHSR